MLMEPTSVVAKAWDQIERVGHRAWFEPRSVLITGAGPIGLLAAMLGVQRGLDVHVLDRVITGPKPDLVSDLGATYHHGDIASAVGDGGLTSLSRPPETVPSCSMRSSRRPATGSCA